MSATLTPKQQETKEARSRAYAMTEGDLRGVVFQLPKELRDRLAQGPLPRRFACGVCEAFGRDFYGGTVDLNDPRWLVWIYHEIPKADMTHRDEQHYGELANETYRRCLATYRAAGWKGEAPEPNA